MSKQMQEVMRCLKKAEIASRCVSTSKTGHDLRDSWEDFLEEFGKAIGKCISWAKQDARTKAHGHMLKNLSTKDDEGLVFLREARNATVHGLEPSAGYEDGITSLFGAFALGPNCKDISFSNNIVNGVNTGTFVVSTDEHGRISELRSDGPVLGNFAPAHIRLKTIVSEEKKKEYKIPQVLAGKRLKEPSPNELSLLAIGFLRNEITEVADLLK